jgi:hypothetical protein
MFPAVAPANSALTLPVSNLPGLHAGSPAPRAATGDLAAGLAHPLVSLIHRAQLQTATASQRGARLRSDAFVFRSASLARRVLGAWWRDHHARRAAVGGGGYLARARRRDAVAWRDGSRLGVIVLLGGRATAQAALRYAKLADRYLRAPLPKTAWDKVLAQIQPDGSVSKRTALQAFALGYHPLPGVTAPSGGKADMSSLTAVDGWILSYLRQLSVAQRRIVERVLGVRSVGHRGARTAFFDDPTFTPTAWVQQKVDDWVSVYQDPAHLNLPMKLKVIAGITNQTVTDEKGDPALADATPFGPGGSYGSGDPTICRIRLTPAGLARNSDKIEALLAHETFHCFQFQILGSRAWSKLPLWILEGQAKWAEMTVDPTGGDYLHGRWLKEYIDSPETPLFERSYDAVGFWGHIQDSVPNLWKKIPAILAESDNRQAYAAAGGFVPAFLDSWGSSRLRDKSGGPPWEMVSPLNPPSTTINEVPITGDGKASVLPYTTYMFKLQAKPDYPLMHVEMTGWGRLSPNYNYTDLKDAWFCVDPTGCECPKNTIDELPAGIRPLDTPTELALTGDPDKGTDAVIHSAKLDEFCIPNPQPPPYHYGNGGSGGDPHNNTFDGAFYDFQAAGEFTLVKSTRGDLEVQVRQQPFHASFTDGPVAVITAAAVRDGRTTVEVDENGSVWLNKHRISPRFGRKPLPGGGSVRFEFGVTAFWRDGTYVQMTPLGRFGVTVDVHAARDRRHHLVGLLGPYTGGNPARDFIGRNGIHYSATKFGGPPFGILYGQWGNSWRITQKQSLFRYPRGKSTRSYTKLNYPPRDVTIGSLSPSARAKAERICRAAGITNRAVLEDCILDVGVTGAASFAQGDKQLGGAVRGHKAPPTPSPGTLPWTRLTAGSIGVNVGPPLSLAITRGQAVVAFERTKSVGVETDTFTPSSTGVSGASHRVPFTGWENMDRPLLLPRTGGQLQLIVTGQHSGNSSDPLNGTSVVPRNADGTFGAPSQLSSSVTCCVTGAVPAADGVTPLWLSNVFGDPVIHSGTTSLDLTARVGSFPSNPVLGKDRRGRVWLAWLGTSGGASTGVYLLQLDPHTGAPLGKRLHVPDASIGEFVLACGAVCRVVGVDGETIVSWGPGDSHVVRVFSGRLPSGVSESTGVLAAAYTSSNRLWVDWMDAESGLEYAKLGDSRGAGGTIEQLRKPPHATHNAYTEPSVTAAATIGDRLVLVTEWSHAPPGHFPTITLWATVANP